MLKNIEAIFVDRDGTLIEDKHYLSDPQGVTLLPHVGETLKKLQDMGKKIFIVSNQSGIGRGYFPERDFHACQQELYRQLAVFGVSIEDTAFCPHDPSKLHYSEFECVEMCDCRKPNIGMWHQLEDKYHLKASACVMIGDKKEDLGFAINAGFAGAFLVATGKGLKSVNELGLVSSDHFDRAEQNQEKYKTQEFSYSLVKNIVPCNMVKSEVTDSYLQTKCFFLSQFSDLATILVD